MRWRSFNIPEVMRLGVRTVLESPGIPVTGSPSILKGYHNSLIDRSPSILVSASLADIEVVHTQI